MTMDLSSKLLSVADSAIDSTTGDVDDNYHNVNQSLNEDEVDKLFTDFYKSDNERSQLNNFSTEALKTSDKSILPSVCESTKAVDSVQREENEDFDNISDTLAITLQDHCYCLPYTIACQSVTATHLFPNQEFPTSNQSIDSTSSDQQKLNTSDRYHLNLSGTSSSDNDQAGDPIQSFPIIPGLASYISNGFLTFDKLLQMGGGETSEKLLKEHDRLSGHDYAQAQSNFSNGLSVANEMSYSNNKQKRSHVTPLQNKAVLSDQTLKTFNPNDVNAAQMSVTQLKNVSLQKRLITNENKSKNLKKKHAEDELTNRIEELYEEKLSGPLLSPYDNKLLGNNVLKSTNIIKKKSIENLSSDDDNSSLHNDVSSSRGSDHNLQTIKRISQMQQKFVKNIENRKKTLEDKKKDAEWNEPYVTRCVCGYTHNDDFMIQCEQCDVWQHAVCMGITRRKVPDKYLCELCNLRYIDKQKARKLQKKKRIELDLSSDSDSEQDEIAEKKSNLSSEPKKHNILPKKLGRPRKSNASFSAGSGLDSDTDWPLSPQLPTIKLEALFQNYEEADRNVYGSDFLEALSDININLKNSNTAMLKQLSTRLCEVLYVRAGQTGLVANRTIPAEQPIADYKGRFFLESRFNGFFSGRRHPFVLNFQLGNLSVVVDARKYGSQARFIRRSCKPNAMVKESFDGSHLHLLIVAVELIERGTEVSIPFDFDYKKSLYPVDCMCDQSDCLIKLFNNALLPAPPVSTQAAKQVSAKRNSNATTKAKVKTKSVKQNIKQKRKKSKVKELKLKKKSASEKLKQYRKKQIQKKIRIGPKTKPQARKKLTKQLSKTVSKSIIKSKAPLVESRKKHATKELILTAGDSKSKTTILPHLPVSVTDVAKQDLPEMSTASRPILNTAPIVVDHVTSGSVSGELKALISNDYWNQRELSGDVSLTQDWLLPEDRHKLSREDRKIQNVLDQIQRMETMAKKLEERRHSRHKSGEVPDDTPDSNRAKKERKLKASSKVAMPPQKINQKLTHSKKVRIKFSGTKTASSSAKQTRVLKQELNKTTDDDSSLNDSSKESAAEFDSPNAHDIGKKRKASIKNQDLSPAAAADLYRKQKNQARVSSESASDVGASSSGDQSPLHVMAAFAKSVSTLESPGEVSGAGHHTKKRWLRQVLSESNGDAEVSTLSAQPSDANVFEQFGYVGSDVQQIATSSLSSSSSTVTPLKKRRLAAGQDDSKTSEAALLKAVGDDCIEQFCVDQNRSQIALIEPYYEPDSTTHDPELTLSSSPDAHSTTITAVVNKSDAQTLATQIVSQMHLSSSAETFKNALAGLYVGVDESLLNENKDVDNIDQLNSLELPKKKVKVSLSEYRMRKKDQPEDGFALSACTVDSPDASASFIAQPAKGGFIPDVNQLPNPDDLRRSRLPAFVPDAVLGSKSALSIDQLRERIYNKSIVSQSKADQTELHGRNDMRESGLPSQEDDVMDEESHRLSLNDRLRTEFGVVEEPPPPPPPRLATSLPLPIARNQGAAAVISSAAAVESSTDYQEPDWHRMMAAYQGIQKSRNAF